MYKTKVNNTKCTTNMHRLYCCNLVLGAAV